MENVFRIIGYAILFAINAVLYWFLHSHFHFTILVLMIAAPCISALINFYLRSRIKVYIYNGVDDKSKEVRALNTGLGRQGEECFFTIEIENKTAFACLDSKLDIEVANDFFNTSGRHVVSVPIKMFKGYKLTLPIVPDYPGLISIKIDRIRIKDLCGFFWLTKKLDVKSELTVLPEEIKVEASEKVDFNQGMLESEESSKRGNDFSDVQEIREYIPGDKLMSIHWKLSAKRDILMVKDRVSMSDKQMAVLPELCMDDKRDLCVIISTTYSLIKNLCANKTTVRLLYWSAARFEYEDVRIDYPEELDNAFEKMFYEKTYHGMDEAASHMPYVHPEMKAFVHVTAYAGESNIKVVENG